MSPTCLVLSPMGTHECGYMHFNRNASARRYFIWFTSVRIVRTLFAGSSETHKQCLSSRCVNSMAGTVGHQFVIKYGFQFVGRMKTPRRFVRVYRFTITAVRIIIDREKSQRIDFDKRENKVHVLQ